MEAQESKMMNDFQTRTQPLVEQLGEILDNAEAGIAYSPLLRDYARLVEMIQNSSRTLGQAFPDPKHLVHRLHDYSGLCKSIALKIADLKDNDTLYDVALALLMDATEVLVEIIKGIRSKNVGIDGFLNQKLVERLQWASYQFQTQGRLRTGDGAEKLDQSDIDDLLKKLGVG